MQSSRQVSVSRTRSLKNNQVKSRKKSFQIGKKRRQGCCSCCEKPQFGCLSQDSEPSELPKGVKYRGNPEAESLGINSTGTISHSPRYVKQVSEMTKDHRLHKSKVPHLRSPNAMKFEDRSQEETERREPCARGRALNLARKFYKLKNKGQSYILFAYQ